MIEITDYLKNYNFATNYLKRERRTASEVFIGDIPLGANHPIRVQSMTTAPTMDTKATVDECIRLIESGCEYVRITAPSKREAENLKNIRGDLHKKGYKTPLIADIHFTPNAADIAARIVEKVRINPGNYVDKKKFAVREYTDSEYEAELERIREKFIPLVKICKEYGTAMRIGTNHGSLSDRIMNRYGDTPVGMVESAMEFLRIAEEFDYHSIVLSMKASNPKVMVEAYRLLVAKMNEENLHYPLHLGVTEAGDGEEARIKSAAGIGALLEDGLGDTVRVSLTEAPENEAPVAKRLIDRYKYEKREDIPPQISDKPLELGKGGYNPFEFKKRSSREVKNIGSGNPPIVIADYSNKENIRELSLNAIDYHYEPGTDKWNYGSTCADFIYLGKNTSIPDSFPTTLGKIYDYTTFKDFEDKTNKYPLFSLQELNESEGDNDLIFIEATISELKNSGFLSQLDALPNLVLIIEAESSGKYAELRKFFFDLKALGIDVPVILKADYSTHKSEEAVLYSATDFGANFIDGNADGIWISYENEKLQEIEKIRFINTLSFNILQAAGARITKTEFIACPSCGRTLFDLQETTTMIKSKTDHLVGVKIAVMGCIVNGPGEMADAHYGYVGTGPGKITLYRGKEVVKRNVESNYALDELIGLIKEDGMWKEKEKV